jgi:hypothetical protein
MVAHHITFQCQVLIFMLLGNELGVNHFTMDLHFSTLKFEIFCSFKKKSTTTYGMLEPTSRKMKIVNENDDIEELNTIEVFDKNNQLIDGATII